MRVSVCLAAYNGERYIEEQVSSIIKQLGKDDELIISDNGSSDDTLLILNSFKDSRIKIYHNPIRGILSNFENSILKSTGKYIFLSDQDDIWLPGRLEEGLKLLEDADLVSVGLRYIDELGSVTNRQDLIPNGGLLKTLLSNTYPGCCLSINRELVNKCLPFPKNIPMHDWWIVLVCMSFGKIKRSNKVKILYRRHENNSSCTGGVSKVSIYKKISWRLVLVKELIKKYLYLRDRNSNK